MLRPADAYVAEFVQHMNPLNVLRGSAVMTPAAALRAPMTKCSSTGTAESDLKLDRRRPAARGDARRTAPARWRSPTARPGKFRRPIRTTPTSIVRAHRSQDALGDCTPELFRQSDRAGRRSRAHGGTLRRRRNLPRSPAAAATGCVNLSGRARKGRRDTRRGSACSRSRSGRDPRPWGNDTPAEAQTCRLCRLASQRNTRTPDWRIHEVLARRRLRPIPLAGAGKHAEALFFLVLATSASEIIKSMLYSLSSGNQAARGAAKRGRNERGEAAEGGGRNSAGRRGHGRAL